MRFIMFGETITIFRNIYTRKPHYEAGGLGSGFSSKAHRMLAHREQQRMILEWAWSRAQGQSDRKRWAAVKAFFSRFKDFKSSVKLFCARVPGA